MTRDVSCVAPDLDLKTTAELLDREHIGGMPVVDEFDNLLGVISKTDVVRTMNEKPNIGLSQMKDLLDVGHVMRLGRFHLSKNATLGEAAALMAFEHVHRLPIAQDDKVVGIVSSTDILRWLGRQAGFMLGASGDQDD